MEENEFSKIKLVACLGNPGTRYERTYHNAGKRFADYLLGMHSGGAAAFRSRDNFEYAKEGGKIIVKPLSFMNESGPAVASAMRFFRIKPADLLVAHDDSDLEIGKYKFSFGSRAAGHHGVESVIETLGTKDFWRFRIGIRPRKQTGLPAEARRTKAGSFVLKLITALDKKILDEVFLNAANALKSGLNRAT